ncbi:MAG: LysR substrate-binding domain-containing protein [Rhodospirillaceae bacterium]|nr:LysR substrate-binding domain-containing protein [Rhodospirillaceae bacterium]
MDRLAALRAFAAVAEAESFSAAAVRLKTSKSAVSKQVTALEHDLGVRLLNRTTRKVGLTSAGETYARRAERLLADLEDADQTVRRQAAAPAGRLRLAAPMTFGIMHLGDFVATFMKKYPDIVVDLNLSDRYIDLIEERVDLAIRIGTLKDSSLQARVLAPSKVYICAAPAYLKAHGTPHKPKDLLAHHCLTYTQADGTTSWRLKGGAINVAGRAHSNNGDILRRLALKGLGLVRVPSFIVGPDIKRGALVSVLEDYVPQHSTINAVYPPSRHVAAPVRAFIDFMAAQCAPKPSWD